MTNVCKCGTGLLPFDSSEVTCSTCTASARTTREDAVAFQLWVRKLAGLPDKVVADRTNHSPHRVYEVRALLGLKKYRTDGFVRAPRTTREHRKSTPVQVSVPTGERFDLGGHVRDVPRFENN